MGSKAKRGRRDKDSRHRRHSSPSAPLDAAKLFRYSALGKTSKLRTLLAGQSDPGAQLNAVTDAQGATALHQAARHGHLETVQLLLRRAADPAVQDAAGNTPGHLAAMHGHLLVLTELVKAAGIDLDRPNTAGLTIRHIVQRRQQAEHGATASGSRSAGSSSPSSSAESDQAAAATRPAAARAAAAAGVGGLHAQGGKEDDWMDKLAYEMSYEDGGSWQGAWGGAMAAAAAAESWEQQPGRPPPQHARRKRKPAAAAQEEDEEEDAWADRLWQDMQEHKRQAAAAAAAAARGQRQHAAGLFGADSSRQEAVKERERKAAAAAAESARILREEQAKDADWRAAMMRQVEEAALPVRRSTYEERWQRLEAWPAGKAITYQDIPWPCPTPGSQAAARKQQHQTLQLDAKQLQTLVLGGAKSAADIKLALRKELMRWHPDKFTARYGARLAAADRDAVQASVKAVAQQLTALKQQ